MKKLFFSLCLLACIGLPACPSFSAQGAREPLVLVLPFQINAGADMARLNSDLPQMVSRSLASKGFRVVSMDRARALSRGRSAQDFASARSLAAAAGADYAVYGVFNQLGEDFTLESRLTPVAGDGVEHPMTAQGQGMLQLAPAVEQLTSQMAGIAGAVGSTGGLTLPAGDGVLDDVQVRGMKVLDPDVVLMRLRLRKGDNPDHAAVDDELKRIWDMGYFSDVQAALEQQAAGRVLVFTVVEKPRVDNIVVNGTSELDKEDILSAMSTKAGSVLNEKLLAEDLQKVT
ncbi:MAG: outer membrane protein assembly factor BamA, partial [Deltaproteobacteria bacterium]|nr:outer membrane protein assembly factor BamA [Deltaproteobacteria bacterium]